MAYATLADLEQRYGARRLIELTDRAEPPAGEPDAAAIAAAIADAGELIDSYLRPVMRLPLDPVPPRLRRVACEIAIYQLHGEEAGKDSKTASDYRDAVAWLRDLAAGKATLGAGGVEPAPRPVADLRITGPARVMSRQRLAGY